MSNVRRLARSLQVDVSTDGTTWLKLVESVDSNPTFAPNLVDSTSYDGQGFGSQEITLQNGTLVVKYNAISSGGVPNPAQELVEACEGQFGDAARLWVRWYDTDGGSRSWKAQAIVTVAPASTGVADLRAITATFTFDGDTVTKTANPYTADVAPVLLSATPSGAATGAQVLITGQHFLDSAISSVKFGAVSVTTYTLVSDSTIVAVMPSGTAGAAAVTVTNATGVSNSLAYTRAA